MAKAKPVVTTTAGNLVRQFARYSDIALAEAVFVTRNGRPRNVLLSVNEYERLKSLDRQSFMAADIPEHFLPQIRALARGRRR